MLVRVLMRKYLAQVGRSRKEFTRLVDRHIDVSIGDRDVATIGIKDIFNIHQSLRDTPYQANRVLAVLSAGLNHAERLEARPIGSNPCALVVRFPEKKRRRILTPDEAAKVGKLLREYEPIYPMDVLFIRLSMLTGAHPCEILQARRSMIVDSVLTHDVHKTDRFGLPRRIYLAPVAMALIEAAPRTKDSDLICCGAKPRRLWALIRVEAGCPDVRVADLRHVFASAGLKAGSSLAQIGELLSHGSTQTTAGYAHLMADVAHDSAAKAANTVQELIGANAA